MYTVFATDKLKMYHASDSPPSPVSQPEDTLPDEDEMPYEVENIVDHRRFTNPDGETVEQYLVHWKGYSSDENSWEPLENLNCPEKLEEFFLRYPAAAMQANVDFEQTIPLLGHYGILNMQWDDLLPSEQSDCETSVNSSDLQGVPLEEYFTATEED